MCDMAYPHGLVRKAPYTTAILPCFYICADRILILQAERTILAHAFLAVVMSLFRWGWERRSRPKTPSFCALPCGFAARQRAKRIGYEGYAFALSISLLPGSRSSLLDIEILLLV